MKELIVIIIFLVVCCVAFGGELVTNGDFAAAGGGGTAMFTGWTNTAAVGTGGGNGTEVQDIAYGNAHGGAGADACNLWNEANQVACEITQTGILIVGTYYRLRLDLVDGGGDIDVTAVDDTIYATFNGTGAKTVYFRALDTGIEIKDGAASTNCTIDNVSIIETDSLNCYVGGSVSDNDHAGYSNLSAAASVGANGQSIYEAETLADTLGSGGKMLITTATDLSDVTGIFCTIVGNAGSEGTGRFQVIAVDTSPSGADTILIDLTWVDDVTDTVDIAIGGALSHSYNVDAYDLENVIDDDDGYGVVAIAAGGDVNIYATGTLEVGEIMMWDSWGGAGNNWVRLIGCDTSYTPSATGTQGFILDADVTNLDATIMLIEDEERIQLKNIAFLNNDSGGGGTPLPGEDGFQIVSVATQYGFLIENCSFDNCYRGIYLDPEALGVVIKDCTVGVTTVNQQEGIENDAVGTIIRGGRFIAKAGHIVIALDAACSIRGAVINEGTHGIDIAATGNYQIDGCSFYNQTTGSMYLNSANATAIITNNIFYVNTAASDYAIHRQAGAYTEYNNITNADTIALSGFINSTGYNLDFTNGNPFVNASGGDFRLVPNSLFALNQGLTVNGGKTSIGAWGPYAAPFAGYRPRHSGPLIYK